jgi:hypothetical protein
MRIGGPNITKRLTEVCLEHIKITEHLSIPLREWAFNEPHNPDGWPGRKILKSRDRSADAAAGDVAVPVDKRLGSPILR